MLYISFKFVFDYWAVLIREDLGNLQNKCAPLPIIVDLGGP